MRQMSSPIAAQIVEHVAGLPEGVPVTAKAFLHLGSRAAVDQILSRLVKHDVLMRPGRGLYVKPVESRFGKRGPGVEELVKGVSQVMGETIVPHGAAAANTLGLSTQVPVKPIYLTSGSTRQLKIGNLVIELRHAPEWQLIMPNQVSGSVIRALAYIGKAQAGEAVEKLEKRLPEVAKAEVIASRPRLPTWLAEQVSDLVKHA
jgi:hypothetical protein